MKIRHRDQSKDSKNEFDEVSKVYSVECGTNNRTRNAKSLFVSFELR